MSGIYLFDKNQKLINTIEEKRLIDPYQEEELNALIKAEFTCKYSKEIEKAFYFGFKEDNNFYMHKVRNIIKKDGFLTDQGVHIMFDELKGKVVRDLRPQNKTPGYALGKALGDTGWTCISHVDNLASTNFYYISALDALYKICSVWKVEFKPVIKFIDGKISAKEIHLYPRLGSDLGRVFSYGNNLVSVLAETNKDDLYTAFIGRGKGEEIVDEKGQATGGYGRKTKFTDIDFLAEKDGIKVHSPKGCDYIEIEEATRLYGYPDGTPKITTVDFDDIEDKEELAKATFDYALENSRPKVQLKASGLEIEQVGLGEIVTIIADMDIRFKTRVFKIKKNILSNSVVSFEFGDKIIKTTADRLKAAQVEKNTETFQQMDYMEQVLKAIESTYYNEDGYQYDLKADNKYNLPAGIYSFDMPIDQNPTKVIYLGAGKLMIADSKKEDGSWRFRTAIDGQSVNADAIRTGILEGGRVFWNLNDGTFRIGKNNEKFSMLWDGETLHLRNVDIDLKNHYEFKEIREEIDKSISDMGQSSKDYADSKDKEISSQLVKLDQDFKLGQGEVESMISSVRVETTKAIDDVNENLSNNYDKKSDVDKKIAGADANIKTFLVKNYSSISQTDEKIESKVSSVKTEINKKIDNDTANLKSYVVNNYSTTTQTASMIDSKISSIKTDISNSDGNLKKYVEENYSTKKQTASLIASEVSSVKTYVGDNYYTNSETNSRISQSASEISTKVTAINDRLGTAESKITQTANEISTKVSKKGLISAINQSAESVKIQASKVDINVSDLQGQINSIKTDINGINLSVKNTKDGLNAEIQARKDAISSAVEDTKSGLRSEIKQSADSINYKVDNLDGRFSVLVTSVFDIEAEVRDTKKDLSARIDVNANGISSKVSKGSIISEINQSAESVRISASKINLDGDVNLNGTFTAKSGDYTAELKYGCLELSYNYGNNLSGKLEVHKLSGTDKYFTTFAHDIYSALAITGKNISSGNYNPYIVFDRYNVLRSLKNNEDVSIYVSDDTYFADEVTCRKRLACEDDIEVQGTSSHISLSVVGNQLWFRSTNTLDTGTFFIDFKKEVYGWAAK